MKSALYLALACCSASVNAFKQFSPFANLDSSEDGFFDSHMTLANEDGRHSHIKSVFEEMRQALEAKEAGTEHPYLQTHGENVDVNMDMLRDWNHVIQL